jgi:hypothetical protein
LKANIKELKIQIIYIEFPKIKKIKAQKNIKNGALKTESISLSINPILIYSS